MLNISNIIRFLIFFIGIYVSPMVNANREASDINTKQQEPISQKNSHNHSSIKPELNQLTLKLTVEDIKEKGREKIVKIKLTHLKDGSPVTLKELKEVHTEKIHLLIIDSDLLDYSHIHPKATNIPGIYEFNWYPKMQVNYHIFADLFPIAKNAQEYAVSQINLASTPKFTPNINRTVSLQSEVAGYLFKLSLEQQKLKAGQASMGSVYITDSKGKPVKNLEPIMGAFAHIVGFPEDLATVIHVHPMGKEPDSVVDRGGPELEFHIEPEKPGFIKLFVQVKIQGKELFAPFGIMIEP